MQKTQQQSSIQSDALAATVGTSGKAVVREVLSGDTLRLQKTTGKDQFDALVHLAYISTPRLGNPNRTEEPFAFEAREQIREKLIGRKCDYTIQYVANGKRFVSVSFEEKDLATLLVEQSLAKANEKRPQTTPGGLHEKLLEIQEVEAKKTKGVWSTDSKYLAKHVREVTFFGEADYKPSTLLAQALQEPRPLAAILEHVFSPSFVSLYVRTLKTVIKLQIVHLFLPQETEQAIRDQGKQFVEKMLLHRSVGVKLARVDDNGTLVGRIHFSAGDIASEVLKRGLCKLSTPKDSDFDANYYRELKQAQLIGQTNRAGVWKHLAASDLQQNKSSVKDFGGRVTEVHSGDSLTIERESDLKALRVFLSSVKAPSMTGNRENGKEPQPEPYAWESKESLRKLAIGKRVRVEMEYDRVVPTRQGQEMTMSFGAVTDQQKNRNFAVYQLERGLLKTNVRHSGENASKYLEDLLAAEKKAADGKLCLHNQSKQPPVQVFADLLSNTKQAKEYEHMVMGRKDKTFKGVVEYCFSGMKFKVRLDSEGRQIALNLLGIRTMALDKNQPTLQEYANDALKMARDSLHQRDVTVELYFADKRGSFFGTISVQNKGDFAVKLLDEGLAQVHLQGNAKAPANMMKYEEAEENAKSKEIGIWGGQLKLMSNQSQNGSNYECGQRIKVEMTDMLDATSFHVRDVGAGSAYAKIDEAMEHFDYQTAEELEKPIKKGTLCAALFATDSKWYRVKVLGAAGKGQVEVRFIDYGNVETVRADQDLRKLPAHLLAYEPQAIQCAFAYIRTPKMSKPCGREAAEYVQKFGLNQVHDAVVAYQTGQYLLLTLMEEEETDCNNSLNAYMVAEGYATIDENEEIPAEMQGWAEFQGEAKDKEAGLWKFGHAVIDQDDDEY